MFVGTYYVSLTLLFAKRGPYPQKKLEKKVHIANFAPYVLIINCLYIIIQLNRSYQFLVIDLIQLHIPLVIL